MPPRKRKVPAKSTLSKVEELSTIEEDVPILAQEDANLTLVSKKLSDIDTRGAVKSVTSIHAHYA
jgi:hypothetical protein